MRKITYKSRAIEAVILILGLILILTVWPMRIWQTTATSSGGGVMTGETAQIDSTHDVVQKFMAQYNRIGSIDIYVTELTAGRYMEMTLYDQNMQPVYNTYVDMGNTAIPGYVKIPLQLSLHVNEQYTMLLTQAYAAYAVAYEDIPHNPSPYVLEMSYQDTSVEGYHLAATYHYSLPLGKKASLEWMALIGTVMVLLAGMTELFYRRNPGKDHLITTGQAMRYTLNPIWALFLAAGIIMVFPLRLFDDRPADLVFYEIGLLITGILVFYGINHKSESGNIAGILHFEKAAEAVRPIGQMIAIALTVKFGCDYMNALYDIYHTLAERRMMICLLCLIILTFSAQELINRYHAVYIPIAVIAGISYYTTHHMAMTEKEYDLHNAALSYAIVIAILGGMILMNLIRLLIQRIRSDSHGQQRKQSRNNISFFGVLTVVFFIVIIVLRNTRWWGVALAAVYGAFYIRYAVWENRDRWLDILSGGLLLNFAGSAIYCLLFRYFAGFVSARFSLVFHTVTVTAEYLTFMECTAVVLLLSKLFQIPSGKGIRQIFTAIWKEFILFGAVSAYVIFTMSRTAYLAVFVACLILLLIVVRGHGIQKGVSFARNLLVCMAAILICFPAVFTLQRIVPAVVGRPYIFTIEDTAVQLHGGADWDNRSFMCVERFESMFMEKILGTTGKSYNYPEDKYNYDKNGNLLYGTDGVPVSGENAFLQEQNTGLFASAKLTAGEQELLLAAANSNSEDTDGAATTDGQTESGLDEFSNGRFTIFHSYLTQMNLTGHDEMGALLPDGEIAVHAHNTYLQVAYDHGVPAGILFALLILSALLAGYQSDKRNRSDKRITILPTAITLGFAIAGLTEWVFQFSNPMTVALLLSWAPLIYNRKRD